MRTAFRPNPVCLFTGAHRTTLPGRSKLPGRGMSTPIVWGDRIFVTSQIGYGKVESRSARYEGPGGAMTGP